MKKRFLGWILALALLVGVLPQLFLGAAAAQTLPAAPNASLRYEECADVSVGTIRYVAQLGISPYFYNSYWGPFADSAGHECFYFLLCCHGGIARRGHGEGAVGCAVVDGLLGIARRHETVDKTGGKGVSPADAVENL